MTKPALCGLFHMIARIACILLSLTCALFATIACELFTLFVVAIVTGADVVCVAAAIFRSDDVVDADASVDPVVEGLYIFSAKTV